MSPHLLIFLFIFILSTKNIKINNTLLSIKKELNINWKVNLNNKIRIALYCPSMKNGGVGRLTSIFLNYLHKFSIFNIYLFTMNKLNDEYIIPKNINRIIINHGQANILFMEIKKKKLDIFIYQNYDQNTIKKLNKLKKTKTIFYIHSSIFLWIYINQYSMYANIYQEYINSNYIISLIPFENDYVFKKWGIKSILMNNFMTYEYEYIIPSSLSANTILFIGRAFDKLKRVELGFQAFEYVLQYISDCKMNIISSINNNYFFENLENNLNIRNNIEFLGYKSNFEIYFKNASLHILPSISEAFPMVLCETKIFGIPNILFGLEYVAISSGGTIIIYDDLPESLAKVSINILKDYKYRKFLGEQARSSMKRFNNELLSKRWVKLILSIFSGKSYYEKIREEDTKLITSKALNILQNEIFLLRKRTTKFLNTSNFVII